MASSTRDDSGPMISSSLSSSTDPLDFLSEFSGDFSGDYGFSRPDFGSETLAGTVEPHRRHVFLCYKNPKVWPPRIQAADFDRLPRLLAAALSARKPHMARETRLTICEGHDGTETSNGDVLIFPDMVRYRRLTHFDVDTFVEEVLVKDNDWLPMCPESLTGSYIFVCCHGSRDRRCGVCGPPLVSRFRDEIELRGLLGKVSVSPCSHIGGHKYAGNVVIFGPNNNGEVTGHWYGYVQPEDVTVLLDLHIEKGEIVDRLWRGQMGLSKEDQIEALNWRLQSTNEETNIGQVDQSQTSHSESVTLRSEAAVTATAVVGCCQENGNDNSSCCQNPDTNGIIPKKKSAKKVLSRVNSGKGYSSSGRRVCSMPTWLESWEREDTFAALAVGCAALSVAVAYSFYKHSR